MVNSILFLIVGFILLIVGGELLVRGAVRLAERAGMSQLLIGLTIVGFGTSAPELVASLEAAFRGSPGIAWGNVVGSNLANSLLILGVASLIMPMAVARGPLWRDGGLALVITALLYYCAYAGYVGIPMGVSFLAILIAYLIYAYISEGKAQRREIAAGNDMGAGNDIGDGKDPIEKALGKAAEGVSEVISDIVPEKAGQKIDFVLGTGETGVGDKAGALEASDTHLHDEQHWLRSLAILVAGIVLIILGGQWLVSSAVEIAGAIGMSETVIGLTVIAIGTSLPELVTSVIAARKGASAVALGNVLGSNLFNLLLIGGLTATLAPMAIPMELIEFGLPTLLLSSILLIIFAATKHAISRTEGVVLLLLYAAQMIYSLASV